jgi:RNA polymerase sigma factor (sigma-70 family)
MRLAGRRIASPDLEALFAGEAPGQKTDAQLLERFIVKRDEIAFEVLVSRHAPMVFRTLSRVLHGRHDAEDAFQATFLVLARKADSVKNRESVGPWLHGVASRIAIKSRADSTRRHDGLRRYAESRTSSDSREVELDDREVTNTIHDELNRLPAQYRDPLTLCYIEGLKCEEIAQRLRRPLGTVTVQLARARDRLRERLARRGVVVPTALLGIATIGESTSAAVSKTLITKTVKAAILFAADRGAAVGAVSMRAASLAEGVIRTMYVTKATIASALVLGFFGTAAGVTAWGSFAGPAPGLAPSPVPRIEARSAPIAPAAVVIDDLGKLKGTWPAVSIEGASGKSEGKGSEADNFKLRVDGEKFKFDGIFGMGRDPAEGTLKLDESKTPKTLEMTTSFGEMLCIYELDGDTLKLCVTKLGADEYPTDFKANENNFVFVFKREKM